MGSAPGLAVGIGVVDGEHAQKKVRSDAAKRFLYPVMMIAPRLNLTIAPQRNAPQRPCRWLWCRATPKSGVSPSLIQARKSSLLVGRTLAEIAADE